MKLRQQLVNRRDALKLAGAGALVGAGGVGLASAAFAKAARLGAATPSFTRFKLGEFEVTIIRDGAISLKGPYPTFGGDQFEEDVQDLARANFLPIDRFELPYAPVLVNTPQALILFDTGNGETRAPRSGHLAAGLKAAGYTPDQVDIVVLTHCHPDHIGGLMQGGKTAFPKARYICGETEYDFWSPAKMADGSDGIARRAKVVQSHVVPLAPKMSFLKNGGDVVTGIRVVASPGHTPGHLAYHIESAGRRLVIWGDAVVHHVMSVQRPEWQLAADMDHDTAIASRKHLLAMAAADRLPVTGYHLPFPAVGFIEKVTDGYRFVPASYQLQL